MAQIRIIGENLTVGVFGLSISKLKRKAMRYAKIYEYAYVIEITLDDGTKQVKEINTKTGKLCRKWRKL